MKKIPVPVSLKDFAKKKGFVVMDSRSIVSNNGLIKFYFLNQKYDGRKTNDYRERNFHIVTIPNAVFFPFEAKSDTIPKMKGGVVRAKNMKELTMKLAKLV